MLELLFPKKGEQGHLFTLPNHEGGIESRELHLGEKEGNQNKSVVRKGWTSKESIPRENRNMSE